MYSFPETILVKLSFSNCIKFVKQNLVYVWKAFIFFDKTVLLSMHFEYALTIYLILKYVFCALFITEYKKKDGSL